MPLVTSFRALRYDERRAGPLAGLVAPPYDVIGPEERRRLRARSPYNVVHLTLPDSESEAARAFREWRAQGVVVDAEPGVWALRQEYVGPDGVPRTREAVVASLRAEPYETGAVLPHERTHAAPKEGRLRLLRALGVQLEPIFLLYEGEPPAGAPGREPDIAVEGTKLWRLDDGVEEAFRERQLLIADGHHRYETTLAYGESQPVLVALVSTADPGLSVLPTHRLFAEPRRLEGDREAVADPLAAAGEGVVEVTRDGAWLVRSDEFDVVLVDSLGHDGIAYTPDAAEAVRRVREGDAAVAYLVRPTPVEAVFAAARRGDVLPQKTTFFYPKLLSGLLFHPL